MEPAVTPTIADTMLRARRFVMRHFEDAGATSADKALVYQPQRHAERRALSYLLAHEVVRMTQEGRYWIDPPSAAAWRRVNVTRTALVVAGTLAVIAGFVAWRRSRRDSSKEE